jgi:hypothetical protein
MVLRGAEKAVAEDSAQLRRYARGKAAERQALLDGEHGAQVRELLALLKQLDPDSAPSLLAMLWRFDWFAHADLNTRHKILALIDTACCRVRVRAGLAPIDDPLPGAPDNVFLVCRRHLCIEGVYRQRSSA